jgi:hypothetical protein
VSVSDGDGGKVVAIQSLSNAQLIKILQLDVCDDELTQMVEEELTRRKSGGACQ